MRLHVFVHVMSPVHVLQLDHAKSSVLTAAAAAARRSDPANFCLRDCFSMPTPFLWSSMHAFLVEAHGLLFKMHIAFATT